ncbi:MAG TPA: 16S rRNA (cytosine(1402)-N(4))-methyltransferase RsmH [Micropepsaceae bacterium]|jgi:16S rRNA (cytosine1402-N4)-methyltransferase|nr:16S rRNA (cytosine(1402)-N(4))-methyltransferase RsmH [Micropepsaceae bacterium]
MSGAHVPVMLDEVMAVLRPRDDAIYVDGTFGGGGYSAALLASANCRVFGIDRDAAAIARGRTLAEKFEGRLTLIHGRFSEMDELLDAQGVEKADGVALDLGVSSFQLDQGERGFSFSSDGPLSMRMDETRGETAADLVNTLPEEALVEILREYGEEKRAKAIARAIVAARPLTRTRELAEIAERVLGRNPQKIHPATRTFQALRIAVNDELGELERGLDAAERVLKPHGRLAVVSFHSLEDRIVKHFLTERMGRAGHGSRHAPEQAPRHAPTFGAVGKNPQMPRDEEARANPRSRSARLRAAERNSAPAWNPLPAHGEFE